MGIYVINDLRGVLGLGILLFTLLGLQVQADWQSQHYRDHALVGKIFSTEQQQWISEKTLMSEIKSKQLLLLGEKHTNIDHHIGQARIIDAWLNNDKPAALVLEMLTYNDWLEYDLPDSDIVALTATLKDIAGAWNWQIYQPILQLRMTHDLPLVGGNLTREQLNQFSSGGQCELARNESSIDICSLLNDPEQEIVMQLIYDAHCGYLPKEHTQPLMQVQLAKDASMSLAMVEMADNNQVALIAGAIHVRKDIGVPVHLRKLGYQSLASIAFINVQAGKYNVQEYFAEPGVAAQYDYVIFTPSDTSEDPCEEFAEQLKKMKHPSTK